MAFQTLILVRICAIYILICDRLRCLAGAAYSPEPLTSNMETYAQREQDLSVDGHELYTQSRCFQIISLLCFSAPDLYLKNLLKLCAGNTLDMAILGDTIGKLLKEWKDVLVLVSPVRLDEV